MLETIREFALGQLTAHGDERAVIQRVHAEFFAAMAISLATPLGAGVLTAIERVRADLDNLRATLAWSLDQGETETTLFVAGSLSEYWTFTGGHFTEGHAWLNRAFQQGRDVSPAAQAEGLYAAAMLALHQGDRAAARIAATQSLELARSLGGEPVVKAAFMLGIVEGSEGHRDAARALAQEAVAATRAAQAGLWLGWSLLLLGTELHLAGDLVHAEASLVEALDHFRQGEGRWGEVEALSRRAALARKHGDVHRAGALFIGALELRRQIRARIHVESDLIGLADLAQTAGDPEAAARFLGAADAHSSHFGFEPYWETPQLRARTKEQVRERLGPAAFQQALDAGGRLTMEQIIAEAQAVVDVLPPAPLPSSS